MRCRSGRLDWWGGVAAGEKLTWRPVPAETTGWCTDGDALETLALEETIICHTVAGCPFDGLGTCTF